MIYHPALFLIEREWLCHLARRDNAFALYAQQLEDIDYRRAKEAEEAEAQFLEGVNDSMKTYWSIKDRARKPPRPPRSDDLFIPI